MQLHVRQTGPVQELVKRASMAGPAMPRLEPIQTSNVLLPTTPVPETTASDRTETVMEQERATPEGYPLPVPPPAPVRPEVVVLPEAVWQSVILPTVVQASTALRLTIGVMVQVVVQRQHINAIRIHVSQVIRTAEAIILPDTVLRMVVDWRVGAVPLERLVTAVVMKIPALNNTVTTKTGPALQVGQLAIKPVIPIHNCSFITL